MVVAGLFAALLLGVAFTLGYVAYPLLNGLNEEATASASNRVADTVTENLTENLTGAVAATLDIRATPIGLAEESTDGEVAEETAAIDDLYREAWQILEQDFFGAKPDVTRRTYAMIHGLVGSYEDPYTFFVEPQPRQLERDELRGSFGGIGAQIISDEQGFTLKPLRDQPAEKAGILDGDRLIRVDDTVITTTMSADNVVAVVRGELGTDVEIAVERAIETTSRVTNTTRATAKELTFTITRAEIRTPSMDWWLMDADHNGSDETANIGFIQHRLFSERSPEEMRIAIAELLDGGADRFIIDLRGNPGGLVNAVVEVASLWVDGGVIMQERKADGSETVLETTANVIVPDAPVVIIVDGGSASASEIFAGALRDHERATLVGEKTFGKGSVQLIRELSDRSSLHVTNGHWFTPNGHKIEGAGLQPDVLIEPGTDPVPVAVETVQELSVDQ